MRRRLLLSYLSLAAIILAILEIPVGILHAREDRSALSSQAQREAQVLAAVASDDSDGSVPVDRRSVTTLATHYVDQARGDVTLYGRTGRPILELTPQHTTVPAGETDDRTGLVTAAVAGTAGVSWHNDEGKPVVTWAAPITGRLAGAVTVTLPASATQDQINEVWAGLGLLGVGVLAITAILGLLLARSLTDPLARLGASVGRLGAGDLGVRASNAGPPEVRALAAQFNDMAMQLDGLLSAQKRFVADASHQLRSPLTALRLRLENLELSVADQADAVARARSGGAEDAGTVGNAGAVAVGNGSAVDDGAGGADEGAGGADGGPGGDHGALADVVAAHREVLRLSRLVDGLLTLSRAEGAPVERQPVQVAEVIAERQAAWSALAEERRVGLRLQPPSRAANRPVLLVPGDLEQVVDNLLANALDKTPPGRGIVMSWQQGTAGTVIHVTDEGPGMTDEQRARAFDRFWQGPGEGGGSSGLGLAIVLQLVRRNGGLVELRPADGGGLDAVITLERVHAAADLSDARLTSS